MLSHFLAPIPTDLPLVASYHHVGLVILSIVVAISMSLLALQTSYIARIATRHHIRHTALFTGAFALGSGVWATHFIGMLAFVLPEQVSYDIGITLLSILPAFVSSWLALNHLSRVSPPLPHHYF